MTAFVYHLVAIALTGGRYSVHSQVNAALDVSSLKRDGLLHDVAEDSGYVDEAAILQRIDLPKYFLPESNPFRSDAALWFEALPREVFLILFHAAEFESGLGD